MRETDGLVATLVRELDEITVADRVRQSTALHVQERMDGELIARVAQYVEAPRHTLTARVAELEQEWDIERVLELQSSATALTGLLLGALSKKRWLLLSLVTSGFLLQHAVQGWCPPMIYYRRMGLRTRREIDLELQIVKAMRGDFAAVGAPRRAAHANEG